MYNMLEQSGSYSMTSGSLWNYHKDEVNDDQNRNDNANIRVNKKKAITSKSFEYMTKIIERVPADNNTLNAEVVVTLRYLSNFWRFFNLLFINCVNGT